jgi:hypothetical protein
MPLIWGKVPMNADRTEVGENGIIRSLIDLDARPDRSAL